jgi:hypothetical protein
VRIRSSDRCQDAVTPVVVGFEPYWIDIHAIKSSKELLDMNRNFISKRTSGGVEKNENS